MPAWRRVEQDGWMGERQGIYGIDLGTTYSVVAYIDETGRPAVVRNSDGEDTTPSVVYFETADNTIVGKTAKEASGFRPDDVVSLIKRDIGNKAYSRTFYGQEFSPSDISGIILAALARSAEEETGRPVREVVITVPAYFGLLEKDDTKEAGEIAGLEVIGIVPEPVATALAYGVAGSANGTMLLVYDLGGATFDITLLKMTDTSVEVLAVDGDHRLGGADWDARLFDYLKSQTIEQVGDDSIEDDEASLQELRGMAEETKKALTKAESKRVSHRLAGGVTTSISVTRAQFEEMSSDLLEQTIRITHRMLDDAEQRFPGVCAQINELLLAGGSSWMPAVAERLKREFSWEIRLDDPDLAVAKGAALYAAGQAEWTGLGPEKVGSLDSAFPQALEAAALTSALVPFVQALAARTADDVYACLRRLLPRWRVPKKEAPQGATAAISIADKYSKLILLLPESLNDEMQETLHRLIGNQIHRPTESEEKWLQISRAPDGLSAWNVELVNGIPPNCVVMENFTLQPDRPEEPQRRPAEHDQSGYLNQLAALREERVLLREMVRYLARDIDPKR